MARWLVQYPGAAPVGPVDAVELQGKWNRQEIPPNTMVCAEGFSQWVPFHTVAELIGAPQRAAVSPVSPPSQGHLSSRLGASVPKPFWPPKMVAFLKNPRKRKRLVIGASVAAALSVVAVALPAVVRSGTFKLATMSPAEAAAYGFKLYDPDIPADQARAIPFFEKACQAGEPVGCTGLGTANFDGQGGLPKNYERAVELLGPACEKGVPRACRKLGDGYNLGRGVKKDQVRARDLYQRACDGGEQRGCYMLGLGLIASDSPPEMHNPKLGRVILEKSCSAGYKDACDWVRKVDAAQAQKARWRTMSVGLSKTLREQAAWDLGRGTVTRAIDVITKKVGEAPSGTYEGAYGSIVTYVWGPPLGNSVNNDAIRASPFSAEMPRGLTCGDYSESSIEFYSYGERLQP